MNNNKFSYTYSAETLEEIENIRKKYTPQEETPLEKLRKLDNSVTNKASLISLTFGIISTLVLGVGMCCCLVWKHLFVLGIVVGILGIAGVCIAYPLYKKVLETERKKIAPQILELAEQIQNR